MSLFPQKEKAVPVGSVGKPVTLYTGVTLTVGLIENGLAAAVSSDVCRLVLKSDEPPNRLVDAPVFRESPKAVPAVCHSDTSCSLSCHGWQRKVMESLLFRRIRAAEQGRWTCISRQVVCCAMYCSRNELSVS